MELSAIKFDFRFLRGRKFWVLVAFLELLNVLTNPAIISPSLFCLKTVVRSGGNHSGISKIHVWIPPLVPEDVLLWIKAKDVNKIVVDHGFKTIVDSAGAPNCNKAIRIDELHGLHTISIDRSGASSEFEVKFFGSKNPYFHLYLFAWVLGITGTQPRSF